jgi:Domain of Unknown Function (DUF1080)
MSVQRTVLALVLTASFAGAAMAQDQNVAPAGFAALFNGRNFDGWTSGSTVEPGTVTPEQKAKWDADLPKHWRVDDGQLVNDGEEPHLITAKDYGDFELWVDWKLAPHGDSGIYLRGCPQVQIWDPANPDAKKHGADKGSGALWNNEKHERWPLVVADKPAGQWNHMYIRMVGEYVTVVLNDKKVVDNVVLENYYNRSRPVPARGPIQLQIHGSETRFRNLYLREIPPDEADKLLAEIRGGEADFEPAFNGKDFTGWIGATDDYEAVDGALRVKPDRGGNLLTKREYGNFVARLEFKLPPGGNNGLAVRVPNADVDAAYQGLEIQVLDDRDPKYADLHEYQVHGSVYGVAPAHRGYLRPLDQWNYEELVVDGDHVEVHVNGFKTLDVHLDEVGQHPADGKEHPGTKRTNGHFGFCGHHDPVAFRNIRIKPLK